MKQRLNFLNLFFFLISAAVIVRLFSLQVLSFEFYRTLAENQHQIFRKLVPVRGEIFVHEGRTDKLVPVVTNIQKDLVYAVPPEIEDKAGLAGELAKILEVPPSEILEKISDNGRKWVALKKELPESVSLKIAERKFPGIYLQPETYRLYAEQSLAAQVLGFWAFRENERVGQYGVEEYFEKDLAGLPGSLVLEKDIRGRWISGALRQIEPAQDGSDIVLALDRAIQFKAEQVIKQTVEVHQADQGSMVILNPETGAVLAMANFPSFDPNTYSKVETPEVFRNPIISDSYEPGSVFKPVTAAAALDAEAISPDETYEDTGSLAPDDFVIRNANNKTYGIQTMTQVLEQSINTGAIYIQEKLGHEKFFDAVRRFGFGETSGISLPAESGGNVKNLEKGGRVHYATAAFGQGITVTALQLAQSYAALANGGKLVRPHIVETIIRPDGSEEKILPEEIRQVISPAAANKAAAMLVSVVERGHGKRAGVPGYYIAGKTGTAQVASKETGGYDPNVTIGTFAGFGPVDNPRFVMVIKVDNPKTVRFAESTAAPAFGEMARYLLNYYQIPPTR